MNLGELLTHTANEYLDDRTDLDDGDDDSLWSDKTIVRYLNEAQRILCRRSWVLIDIGHPVAGVIVLQTGKEDYPLHKSVLRVYKATPTDTDLALARTTDSRLSYASPANPEFFDVNTPTTATPGRPLAITSDIASRTVRVFPVPSSVEAGIRIELKVARMPVCFLDVTKKAESPEVPEEWHLDLCKYAAGQCLTRHADVDAELRSVGRSLLDDWERALKEARQERTRQEYAEPRPRFASSTAYL